MVALRKLGFDEVYEKETGVTKGNLEGLTIVVKSERPGQFNRYQ
jgi:hypothetical protein